MSQASKVIKAFLNSAEGYFHTKRVLEDQVKQPRNVFGPNSDRPERWDYTDIKDITPFDLRGLVLFAAHIMDKELYNIIPEVALHAALQMSIQIYDRSRFQSKINSNLYNLLFNNLKEAIDRG